jgi:hypothetical protein
MKVIVEKDDETLVVKGAKMAYAAVKNKLVSILTGHEVLSNIGTVLSLLSFLPGVDKDAVENKMKELSGFLNSKIEDFDEFMKSIPMLETLFGDEKDCLKNIMRFEVFVQQISLGQYPAENYDLGKVTAVQSTFMALIAIWTAFGAGVVGSGGLALCVAWIVKDLSVLCYNKVFPIIEEDLKKFEEWAKSNNMDIEKTAKDISDGKAAKGDENKGTENQEGNKEQADESLVGALVKGAAKLVGKGAAKGATKGAAKGATKAAAKGATTLTGKAAAKLAPAATKGLTKMGSKALKAIAKISPKTAQVLKKGSTQLGKMLQKSGISMDYALGKVGDYIANAYEKASNEDKKILDVMKEDLKSATDVENLKAKLKDMIDAMDGNETEGNEVVKESGSWIPLNESRSKFRWIPCK